jgi:DNA repair protein RecN (Recombination protein N)
VEYSEQAINDTISRIDVLERLMSKDGSTVEKVLEYRERAAARSAGMEDADAEKARLAGELRTAEKELAALSKTLSRLRRKVAGELEAGVARELAELNFAHASFTASFKETGYSAGGIDDVEFLLSANKGQPPLPVARIASGGEMSRIMLALKSVTAGLDRVQTMIFDEIDAGISGVTASVVGEKLRRMADGRQIICITHLPQIAAYADRHYVIEKSSSGERTLAAVRLLDDEGRVDEIARLASGSAVTETTRKSARELIAASRML